MQFTAEIVSLPEATDLQLILVERWENDIMPTNTYRKKMCCHNVYTCTCIDFYLTCSHDVDVYMYGQFLRCLPWTFCINNHVASPCSWHSNPTIVRIICFLVKSLRTSCRWINNGDLTHLECISIDILMNLLSSLSCHFVYRILVVCISSSFIYKSDSIYF